MSFLRVSVAASAVLLAGTGLSAAADLGPAPTYSPPPSYTPASVFSWTGPYVGALAGYGWGVFTGPPAGTAAGLTAGAFVGYNMQNGPWVYGLEADALWSGRANAAGDRVRWESTFRGRVGYAFDRFMVYGTAGLAVAGVTEVAPAVNSTQIGLALGAGAEVAFTDNVFGRLEYQYANYGVTPNHTNLSTHEVRVGIGVKF